MKKIPLTRGLFTLVDDEDYEWLNQWKWYAQKVQQGFYAARQVNQRTICLHREIFGLKFNDGLIIDHINRNRLDNRRFNLRICTPQENSLNRTPRLTTSKYNGVSWDKTAKKWRAQITINRKTQNLGRFKQENVAALTYDMVAIRHFGDFAQLNFN